MRCLGIAQSQEDWYLRYLARSRSTHQPAVMMRSFGYMYKMRSFGYKPVGGGEGRGIGDYWSCCVVFHHINKPPRGKGRNLSAVHFTFSFYYRTGTVLSTFHTSSLVVASSRAIDRKQSQNINIVLSHVIMYICHRMFTRARRKAYYTYITRCVTKRKTPTK